MMKKALSVLAFGMVFCSVVVMMRLAFSWRALKIKAVGGCILDSSMTRDLKRRTVDGLP